MFTFKPLIYQVFLHPKTFSKVASQKFSIPCSNNSIDFYRLIISQNNIFFTFWEETISAKSFKRKVAKICLDSYASYICNTKTVNHVNKLSLYYLLHPVVHKDDFNNLC